MNNPEFNETKQLYLEKYGDAVVTSHYLRIAVALLCLTALGLVVLNLRTIRTFQNFRPLVIRIDELGRAQAVDYKSLEYTLETARLSISCLNSAGFTSGATATPSMTISALMQVLCHFMLCIRTAYSDNKTQNKVGISIAYQASLVDEIAR